METLQQREWGWVLRGVRGMQISLILSLILVALATVFNLPVVVFYALKALWLASAGCCMLTPRSRPEVNGLMGYCLTSLAAGLALPTIAGWMGFAALQLNVSLASLAVSQVMIGILQAGLFYLAGLTYCYFLSSLAHEFDRPELADELAFPSIRAPFIVLGLVWAMATVAFPGLLPFLLFLLLLGFLRVVFGLLGHASALTQLAQGPRPPLDDFQVVRSSPVKAARKPQPEVASPSPATAVAVVPQPEVAPPSPVFDSAPPEIALTPSTPPAVVSVEPVAESPSTPSGAPELIARANSHCAQREYAQAEQVARQALALLEAEHGADSKHLVPALKVLAASLNRPDSYVEKTEVESRALTLQFRR